MCGLFASIGFEPDSTRLDIVAHRGPDGRGFETFESEAGPVALGHRRLAIIDISRAGAQPMADAASGCHLVFNGEIYNYVELRQELEAKGEVFASGTDTEVLLRAYCSWGEDCLRRLRGMFAFVVWDARRKKLFAARDRFGIKPLYWTQIGGAIAFGSEIKQLLRYPRACSRMNIPRVHDFLANGITDHTDQTLFEGIRQLRGGEAITVTTDGGRAIAKIRRWYPVVTDDLQLSEEDAASRFRDLLSQSVKLHLRSDVPVGSCLSGGLDSSSIVCLMSLLMPAAASVNTVSACYSDKSVDEKRFMEVVVAQTGAQPHFIFPRAEDVFSKASDITWHQDEPFGSTSIFAQWSVFEEARRVGVKVMLDGQGADEQLAGYHSGFPFHLARLFRRGRMLEILQTMRMRRRLHGASMVHQAARGVVPLLPEWLARPLRGQRLALTQHDWLSSDILRAKGNPQGAMGSATELLGLSLPHDLKSLCMVMTFASNLQMLLHWEDRNSMAHSIEARVPFLDHPLVEFSLALGNDHKMAYADTKRVLRRAMEGVLPESVRNRHDKLGFTTPEEAWFCGPLKGLVHDGVERTLTLYPDLLNKDGVRALRDNMLAGRRRLDFALWRIVNLGLWGDRFQVSL